MRQSSLILLASLLLICAKASAYDLSAEALLQQMQSAVSQQNFEPRRGNVARNRR